MSSNYGLSWVEHPRDPLDLIWSYSNSLAGHVTSVYVAARYLTTFVDEGKVNMNYYVEDSRLANKLWKIVCDRRAHA